MTRVPPLRLAEDGAHHVVVLLRPVETLAQAPEVDDVAHEEQVVDFDGLEEFQQLICAAVLSNRDEHRR